MISARFEGYFEIQIKVIKWKKESLNKRNKAYSIKVES